ncbi:MAG: hypothetical protein H6Q75_489 [Firmicutes bacterium]|nr:hypothetical protein [Bacillota bacterium]
MKLGTYRHYKGNRYQVLGIARHSETEEPFVVYKQLYGDESLWIRPFSMFNETICVEGKIRPRFEFISES